MSAIVFAIPLLDDSIEQVDIAGFIRHGDYVTAFRDTHEGHSAMLAFSMVPKDLRAIMLDEVTAAIARFALIETADLDMGNRIRRARVALIRANQRRDLFAAACAVEQLERAVQEVRHD